ncbi:MAG: FtsW/RodA/SpoVE family cell cycle protein [Verrucomicrobiota bacterium]|nr:FtsW/RodA/SpoVE family cell cycle protein [Verrucomicrobiota bacterium]
MGISLLLISSMTGEEGFCAPVVKAQLRWIVLGWGIFFSCAWFDYRKLRSWGPFLYLAMLLLLLGLFITEPIQHVHRWYRIPYLANVQPSEQAKIILIIALGLFLERQGSRVSTLRSGFLMGLLVLPPFVAILKEPDLGTALVLLPVAWIMGYAAGVHRTLLRISALLGVLVSVFLGLLFVGILSHEEMRPFCTRFLKDYQYERLSPNTYHHKAAKIAFAIGGLNGVGWNESQFSKEKWLPYAHTDSVFAAFGEEFGLIGAAFLLFLFYALIYVSFQVAKVARDPFGRFLAIGLSSYLAIHVVINCAMMCALLPITGVPLILITYGGSSLLTTMATLGLLQSIYSRRFMF